jgi:Xaa-Pro aminopeptidase
VYTAHPTLLIGPSDWRPDVMPREEFQRRIDALWQATPAASHAIVFGSPAHHAELAYFTNLVPKLEAAAALIARSGEHRLFVGGGANMLGAAKPLSFIGDMAPLNGLVAALKQIASPSPVLLIGGGYMTTAFRQTTSDALDAPPQDATAQAWALMRRKSRAEIDAVRAACETLQRAMQAMGDAQRAGAGITDVVLAGERTANEAGAQDVRTLFSVDGGRTLRPFTTPVREAADPLQVYMAVRAFNYWAEGFALLSSRPQPAAEKAAQVLCRALAAIKAGTRADDIARMIVAGIAPQRLHPMAECPADAIGLTLDVPPYTDVQDTFTDGEAYSLKVGLTDATSTHAIASAMIAVRQGGSDVLWHTPLTNSTERGSDP